MVWGKALQSEILFYNFMEYMKRSKRKLLKAGLSLPHPLVKLPRQLYCWLGGWGEREEGRKWIESRREIKVKEEN